MSGITFSPEIVEKLGVIVSLGWLVERFLVVIRDWRQGSPELRAITKQLDFSNRELGRILARIVDVLERP